MTILVLILSLAAMVTGGLAFSGRRNRILGALSIGAGLVGLLFLGGSSIQGIPLPELFALPTIEIPMVLISGVLAFTLLMGGAIKQWPRAIALGLAFLILFYYLVFAPSVWFLVIGLAAAAAFIVSETSKVARKVNVQKLVTAAAMVLLLVASVIGVKTSPVLDRVSQMFNNISAQLVANNDQFASYEQMCSAAQAGSQTALLCGAINQNTADIADLKVKVDANTTAIQTLTGQVATVTEKADDQQVTIQSDPSADDAAAAALAKELTAAGWGPDTVSVNNVNEEGKIDQQGNNAFGSRIRTKAKLVEVLNGSSAQETAIRDRVTSQLPESERARALSGDGWYAVQFKQSVCISGSDWFQDGQPYSGDGHVDCHAAGDVYWVYVGSDGKIYWGAAVRDDCNNPHLDTAPAPQGTKQAEEVCPEGTDRAGQMVGSGCDYPKETPPSDTPPSEEQPPSTPPPSTPPSTPPTTNDAKEDLSPRDPDRDPMPAPTGAPETAPVVNTKPADPSTKPGAPATEQAPGASEVPSATSGQPAPETVTEISNDPSSPATGDQDPG